MFLTIEAVMLFNWVCCPVRRPVLAPAEPVNTTWDQHAVPRSGGRLRIDLHQIADVGERPAAAGTDIVHTAVLAAGIGADRE